MIAAVIVLFHPDLRLLDRLIVTTSTQIERLIIIDNTPGPGARFSAFLERYGPQLSYQALGENCGIAAAQNLGIRTAFKEGFSHVLLLDQDSSLQENMVEQLLRAEAELLSRGIEVGVVGPGFVDEKTGTAAHAVRHCFLRVKKIPVNQFSGEPVEADYLISSGSIMRTSVLCEVGMMKEELFIDWVDIEWCLRAKRKGYRSYVIPSAVMKHSIGDSSVRIFGEAKFLHNDIRNYYIVRNATYLVSVESMGWEWRLISAIKVPQYVLFYSFHSEQKLKSLMLLTRAVWDGLRGKLGPFQ